MDLVHIYFLRISIGPCSEEFLSRNYSLIGCRLGIPALKDKLFGAERAWSDTHVDWLSRHASATRESRDADASISARRVFRFPLCHSEYDGDDS